MVDLRRWDWQAGKLVNDPPEDPLPEREEQEANPAREEEDYGWRPWD